MRSHLNKKWFEGLDITYEDDDTVLSGYLEDQSALYGLLSRLANLNLTLISVNLINSDQ